MIPGLRSRNARTSIRLVDHGRVREVIAAPAAEDVPGSLLPSDAGRLHMGGLMGNSSSAGGKGTGGLIAYTIVAFVASLFFLVGALSHPGIGSLWAAGVLWAVTGVVAAVRVRARHRAVAAAPARTPPTVMVPDFQESLIIRFTYGMADLEPLFRMDEDLHRVMETSDAGEYDGHEIAVNLTDGSLYFYGPSAARIRELISPSLVAYPFMTGASFTAGLAP